MKILLDGKEVDIVNLTEHEITIVFDDGSTISIPSSVTKENIPRVETYEEKIDEFLFNDKIVPVFSVKYGEVINLPPEKENTIYIVPQIVLQRVNRKDLISPNTSPKGVVRDTNGKIIGVRSFFKNP